MKNILLSTLFCISAFFATTQIDYLMIKDSICPSKNFCGFRDSADLAIIYPMMIGLDTNQITNGIVEYYDDLQELEYELYVRRHADTVFLRRSANSSVRGFFHDPENAHLAWSAAFCYHYLNEREKMEYYLLRYADHCPRKWWDKQQIGYLLDWCPSVAVEERFGIKKSHLFYDTLYSESMKEDRKLTIYLPKGFKEGKSYPVVYMADGQLFTRSYRYSLDSLIESKSIPKIVVVGVHSDETLIPGMGLEYRNFEYIKNLHGGKDTLNKLFAPHFQFFTREVIDYAQTKYSVSEKPEDRVFYGVSNGADFGVTVAQEQPNLMDMYILCSIIAGSKEPFNWSKVDAPKFYISCGEQEDEVVQNEAIRLAEYLKSKSIPFEQIRFEGGHDRKKWENQFIQTLSKCF